MVEKKELFWTEKINTYIEALLSLNKFERQQYRFDTLTLLKRTDVELKDHRVLQLGLWVENGAYICSKLYFPLAVLVMHR